MNKRHQFELYRLAYKVANDPKWYETNEAKAAGIGALAGAGIGALTGKDLRAAIRNTLIGAGVGSLAGYSGSKAWKKYRNADSNEEKEPSGKTNEEDQGESVESIDSRARRDSGSISAPRASKNSKTKKRPTDEEL